MTNPWLQVGIMIAQDSRRRWREKLNGNVKTIIMKLWLLVGRWRLLIAGEVCGLPVLLLKRAGLAFGLKITFIFLMKGLFVLMIGPIFLCLH
jgi:hypothetical protein